jgi:small subunit ribosomal protein S4
LGLLPGLTNKTRKLPETKKLQEKKKSQYRIRLEEKQKLRFYYGLTERQLLRYVRIARKTKGSTGQALLQLLEMRLDNTIFRLGMTNTIPAARQLVNHGHILVNKRKVNIPSYRCKLNDKISIRNRNTSKTIIENNLLNHASKIPNHLTFQEEIASVNQLVSRESVGIKVNELLIVEYYSRQA